MPVDGYIAVRENDWIRLNQALRTVYDRLSKLEGKSGTTKQFDHIDMSGHLIQNGPVQTTAQHTDYITRGYLSTAEGARTVIDAVKSSGAAPSLLYGLPIPARPRSIVDRGDPPRTPQMSQGEAVFLDAPTVDKCYLVYFDGKRRLYFQAGGADLY